MRELPILHFEDDEITQVREKPAEVVALRNRIYLVVTDQPEQSIQEFDIDGQGRLLDEVSATPSNWSFEEIQLEDESDHKYFTYDFGKAVIRYMEVLEASRDSEEAPKEEPEEIKFDDSNVDVSDIDQLARDLGLTDGEKNFFN